MPLIRNNKIAENIFLAVWEITESLDELHQNFLINEKEMQAYEAISNEGRKKQWLVTRKLLYALTNNPNLWISHYGNRKPYLNDENLSISISHTSNYVAILLGENIKLGIDIEKLTSRIYKIRNKFCSETENEYLTDDENLLPRLYLIWSAKEALFKMYGEGNLDFRKNLHIQEFEFSPPGKLKTKIKCHEIDTEVELYYDQIGDHVLVYGMTHLK
jgi:4'-phosphopantetheinyl transferase